jgi:hypothetical protein
MIYDRTRCLWLPAAPLIEILVEEKVRMICDERCRRAGLFPVESWFDDREKEIKGLIMGQSAILDAEFSDITERV